MCSDLVQFILENAPLRFGAHQIGINGAYHFAVFVISFFCCGQLHFQVDYRLVFCI